MVINIDKFIKLREILIKKKIKGLTKTGGRNNKGKITVRHKGKGHKRKYRQIDFSRKTNSVGITCRIEYDPNRNANIASIFDYLKKDFFYILAPKNLKVGDIIKSGPGLEPKLGYSLPISEIPVGSYIYNLSMNDKRPGQISRAAGTFSIIKEKTLDNAKIKLSSGKLIFVSPKLYASIGVVSNEKKKIHTTRKAGRSRWLNKRPTVRGVAMNPVDHPHGGGEGKKSGKGRTPWGKPSKKGLTKKSQK